MLPTIPKLSIRDTRILVAPNGASNSKDIFASGIIYIMSINDLDFNKLIGLIISAIGAILITCKSLIDNIKLGFYEEKRYYIQLSDLNDDAVEPNKL